MTEQTQTQTQPEGLEVKPTTVQDSVSVALGLPTAADKAQEAMEAAKAQEAKEAQQEADAAVLYAVIQAELRDVTAKAGELERSVARVLLHAARAAGPGNVKAFDRILDHCEGAVLDEYCKANNLNREAIRRFGDLGEAARSYQTYKSHFRWYIEKFKASFPATVKATIDGQETDLPVDDLAERRRITSSYNSNRKAAAAGATARDGTHGNGAKGTGTTAAKSSKDDADAAPVVQTAAEDDAGEPIALTVGTTRATVNVRGEDGTFHREEVPFGAEVQNELSRVLMQVGKALKDGVPPDTIVAALHSLYETLGDLIPGKLVSKRNLPKPTKATQDAVKAAKDRADGTVK